MNETKLTTKEYWDDGYKDFKFSPMPDSYPTVKEIYSIFKKTDSKNVLEIGCFPGRLLYHFGKLGYELNGIDHTEYLQTMINWFKSNNFKIGEFRSDDIFNISYDKQYDVVFSSGFIEHFSNFDEVIEIHKKLVAKDGYLFLTAPNFSGAIQNKLHKVFDKDNLDKHYIPSMDVEKWKKIVTDGSFEIIKSEYIGGFDFWVGNQKRTIFERIIIKIIRLLLPLRFVPNSRSYSPEILLIAKKIV